MTERELFETTKVDYTITFTTDQPLTQQQAAHFWVLGEGHAFTTLAGRRYQFRNYAVGVSPTEALRVGAEIVADVVESTPDVINRVKIVAVRAALAEEGE